MKLEQEIENLKQQALNYQNQVLNLNQKLHTMLKLFVYQEIHFNELKLFFKKQNMVKAMKLFDQYCVDDYCNFLT